MRGRGKRRSPRIMKIIGHRGARGLAPENTLLSFQAALDAGVDGIECDVRISSDGVPVLVHDVSVKSITGELHEVAKRAHQDLKIHHPHLITLEEAIRFVDKRVPLYIEIKPGTKTEPISELLTRLLADKWRAKDFQFVSFDFKILQHLHARFPEVGIVVNDDWSGVRACLRARRLGTKQIDINAKSVWIGFVRGVSRRGWQLYVFTQNDVKQARRWQKAGLAGVITDYPDRFQ
jgi:glycerophosphoryl diester phosphodiesterase